MLGMISCFCVHKQRYTHTLSYNFFYFQSPLTVMDHSAIKDNHMSAGNPWKRFNCIECTHVIIYPVLGSQLTSHSTSRLNLFLTPVEAQRVNLQPAPALLHPIHHKRFVGQSQSVGDGRGMPVMRMLIKSSSKWRPRGQSNKLNRPMN